VGYSDLDSSYRCNIGSTFAVASNGSIQINSGTTTANVDHIYPPAIMYGETCDNVSGDANLDCYVTSYDSFFTYMKIYYLGLFRLLVNVSQLDDAQLARMDPTLDYLLDPQGTDEFTNEDIAYQLSYLTEFYRLVDGVCVSYKHPFMSTVNR